MNAGIVHGDNQSPAACVIGSFVASRLGKKLVDRIHFIAGRTEFRP